MAIDSLGLNQQMLRLSGLSSGMDTEYVISGLLKIDQLKVDKQFQAKTKLEWKADALRDINLSLRNFREANMSVLNPKTNMFSQTAYQVFDVTMLDETSAVSISANSSAFTGSLKIDSIDQLATSASVSSVGIYSEDTLNMDTALSDFALNTPLQFESGEISFSINGETFAFGEDATVGEMINEINANTAAGVRMSYSNLKKGFTITSKELGSTSEVAIVNISGNAFAATDAAFGIAEGTAVGQDAMLSIENIAVTKSSNNFTIDGISYSLKSESATSISFNVERDVDSAMDNILAFIDNYNELVENLQGKLDEPVYRTYDPLTDEQREQLSESQAEDWEEMAKSGLLHGNSDISFLLSKMRNAFYTNVESVGKSLADIGLRTGSYLDNGKITVNETTLRSALENNPDEVMNLFIAKSDAVDEGTKFDESGLIPRISEAINAYIDQATDVALAYTEREISSTEDRMNDLIDRMQTKEDALWRRFTAMETAMAKLNNQAGWLQSQMVGMMQQ